jgi:urease beta subunit
MRAQSVPFQKGESMKADAITRVGARAVDVGYYNVKYTLGRKVLGDSSTIATGIFPSLVPRLANNLVMHSPGTIQADGCVVEIEGVRYFVGNGAVFNSSGMESRPVLEDYSSTDKYLALLRGAFHYMALDAQAQDEMVIEQLVLGLPLNTFHKYKDGLVARAQGDHLIGVPGSVGPIGFRRVTVERVQVVVQPQGAPLQITSHWRIFSLPALLTWQWRYLAFHGPARLVVKGGRGVRIEPATRGRIVGEGQILGFSTDLAYAVIRSETFWPYFFGREALLKDRVEAGGGVLLIEEAPLAGKSGIRRGIEGLADAALKLVGI